MIIARIIKKLIKVEIFDILLIIMKTKKLYRSDKNKILAGVCGGLGEYAGIDPVLFRLIWILIFIFIGFSINFFPGFIFGLIAYFLAIIVIPKRIEK